MGGMGNRVRFESRMLARGEYFPDRLVLRLEFQVGTVYEYSLVPASVFQRLRDAESAGTFFRSEIADRYPSRRLK
jgi:hypothetical protein